MIEEQQTAELDRYEHHTRREIAEQPAALRRTDGALWGRSLPSAIAAAQRLVIIACGSSLNAAAASRSWLEQLSGLPCDIEVASEFRYRQPPMSPGSVAVLVSQSGETADTLAAMSLLRERAVPIVAVVNVSHSSMAREADLVWPTTAGREQGVAATKSFTTQLAALLRLGMAFSAARGGDATLRADVEAGLTVAPAVCAATEDLEPALAELAHFIAGDGEALFIGRCSGAAIAAEAALKVKELSYIRAEAYPAGELKHGPIALIHTGTPVIVFAGSDALLAKTVSNAEEVRARGARVIAFTDADGAAAFQTVAETVLALPGRGVAHMFAQAVAQQLLAYHAALALDRNVDRPRNLAKSVTVE
jgi:glucosamine--fructose-6-phosphate aminotransferase (isomerizing)